MGLRRVSASTMPAMLANKFHLQPFAHMMLPHPCKAAPMECTVSLKFFSDVCFVCTCRHLEWDCPATLLSSSDNSRLMARTSTESFISNPRLFLYLHRIAEYGNKLTVSIMWDRFRDAHIVAAPGDAIIPPVLDAPRAPGFTPRFIPLSLMRQQYSSSTLSTIGRSVLPSSTPSLLDIVLSNPESWVPRLVRKLNSYPATTFMIGVDCEQVRLDVVSLLVSSTASVQQNDRDSTSTLLQHSDKRACRSRDRLEQITGDLN